MMGAVVTAALLTRWKQMVDDVTELRISVYTMHSSQSTSPTQTVRCYLLTFLVLLSGQQYLQIFEFKSRKVGISYISITTINVQRTTVGLRDRPSEKSWGKLGCHRGPRKPPSKKFTAAPCSNHQCGIMWYSEVPLTFTNLIMVGRWTATVHVENHRCWKVRVLLESLGLKNSHQCRWIPRYPCGTHNEAVAGMVNITGIIDSMPT